MPETKRLHFANLLTTGLMVALTACGQSSLETTLDRYNNESVPYITTKELSTLGTPYLLLDTRKKREFEVSHLSGAIWSGYRTFDLKDFQKEVPSKETPIIVYCSVGVRSENIGEKLLKAGYSDVKNLYGGIFEWKNQGYPVYTANGQPTEKVHAYNKRWGRFLQNAEKIY